MSATITRVQMPDGRLMRIEGGDPHSIANLINGGVVQTNAEEPLEVPVLNFAKTPAQAAVVENSEETALELPSLVGK